MSASPKDVLSEILSSKNAPKIKLLGDSITHGVGGEGFAQSGVDIVEGFKRNPDGFCWAKLFSEHMKERYGCKVVNNACTGTAIEFIIRNLDTLVDADDDLVICTIGTNNRHQYFTSGAKKTKEELLEKFYANICLLYSKLADAGKRVIFVANIPASEKNEADGENYWRILHMSDIRDAYKRASAELGFPLVSMYDLLSDYCSERGIDVDVLLKDGLHPNDEGYTVMFELMKEALGLSAEGA